MKIVYLHEHSSSSADGVAQKMQAQVETWGEFGHKVDLINANAGIGETKFKRLVSLVILSEEDKKLLQQIEALEPDLVYVRFPRYRHFYKILAKRYRVALEVNTLDVAEVENSYALGNCSRIAYYHAILGRKPLLNSVQACIFVSREILEHETFSGFKFESIVVPNSIMLESISTMNGEVLAVASEDKLQIVFMGTEAGIEWHGLDDLIEFSKLVKNEACVHVIGMDDYKQSQAEYLKFHGKLEEASFSQILGRCDLAIGTAALYRKKMSEACPLKTRTYAKYGLPMVLPYRETALKEAGETKVWWALELPCKANVLTQHFNEIIGFAKLIRGKKIPAGDRSNYFGAETWEKVRLDFISKVSSKK